MEDKVNLTSQKGVEKLKDLVDGFKVCLVSATTGTNLVTSEQGSITV